MTAVSTFRLYTANFERSVKTISETPLVERETAYYMENIGKVKSIDDFMADRRLYGYAMNAYGLGEMEYARAFIKKILEGGIDDPDSLANRLTDRRYLEFVEDFNFARYGETTTSFSRTQEGTVEKYYLQTMELEAGAQNEGARLALYFQRKVDAIETAADILGDRALLQVVQTATGLPVQMSFMELEKQEELINDRLDIEDLSDPEKLSDFLNRFVSLWDINNPQQTQVPTIIPGANATASISDGLLSSLQNVKFNR